MPMFDLRAIMLDPARLMDRKERYTELLPRLASWGYNVLHFHITDDEGCRMVFPRRPELASPGAFTAEEMKALVERARDLGIEVIPEIEALGHTRYITQHEKYTDLAEPVPRGGFNAICPTHPETRAVIGDLLADAADIFTADTIHVGLDEVRFGECPRCGPRASEDRFVGHALWIHETVRALGKRSAMWGDHMLTSERIADAMPRDVLVFDWHYEARVDPGTIEFFLDRGFEVVEAPAAVAHCSARLAPTRVAKDNLRHATAAALAYRGRGLRGIDVTAWTPYRHFAGVAEPMVAFGGHLLTTEVESGDFWRAFAAEHYGLGGEDASALEEFYDALLPPRDFDDLVWRARGSGPGGREYRRMAAALRGRMGPIAKALSGAASRATRHADDLRGIALTADVAAAIADAAAGTIGAVSEELVARVEAAWTRDRDAATLETHGHRAVSDRPRDCLLCILDRCRRA